MKKKIKKERALNPKALAIVYLKETIKRLKGKRSKGNNESKIIITQKIKELEKALQNVYEDNSSKKNEQEAASDIRAFIEKRVREILSF